ncbi:MAG: CpsD/CapB family tyrosine-protein kinase [Magnetococcales bacterium]|nr:CpsD/CapB family tyrosine-protein kinase [Magnetococcales bacterium]
MGRLSDRMQPFLRNRELSRLQGKILTAAQGRSVRSLFFTSPRSGDGKTTAAISTAYSLATEGQVKVLLVDGNHAAPCLHRLFELPVGPGLVQFLAGEASLEQVVHATGHENLRVMSHGAENGLGITNMGSEKLKEEVAALMASCDCVVLDGPGFFVSSDAALLAPWFDATLMVIQCERTKKAMIELLRENIHQVGGNLLGVVLNKRKYYIPRIFYG